MTEETHYDPSKVSERDGVEEITDIISLPLSWVILMIMKEIIKVVLVRLKVKTISIEEFGETRMMIRFPRWYSQYHYYHYHYYYC